LKTKPFLAVILSAVLFGLSPPLAKLLLKGVPPVGLAGILYLGVFVGLTLYSTGRKTWVRRGRERPAPLEKKDRGWLVGAVVCGGILGPICLMTGLSQISGFSASLLLNLEGLFTALIAVFFFKEDAGRRIWLALGAMTLAGVFLAWDPRQARFHITGSLLVLLAMLCWGLDNNFTRNISDKDPIQIARIKGFFAGAASLSLAVVLGFKPLLNMTLVYSLGLGAVSYGLSLVLFIKALEGLGAFRTGAFFSLAPFVGACASFFILKEPAGWSMFPAALLMAAGVWLVISEKHGHAHKHERMVHTHSHTHGDPHHTHRHAGELSEPHAHEHEHEELDHVHGHWPDIHHRHGH
jgi:drug/metabolite transporter (DMT)-like permease